MSEIHGAILKRLRLEKGWTQKDLAEKLNKAESTIGMWEQGRRELDYDSLKEIADLFDVSIDFLLGRVKNKQGRKGDNEIVIDDFQFALYGEVKDLTDDEKKDILDMVKILKKQKERK